MAETTDGAAPLAGTVTLLFTAIEGSTALWERQPEAMKAAFPRYREILQEAVREGGGRLYKTMGDDFQAAFRTAGRALLAALNAQRALRAEPWPGEIGGLGVAMALHSGIIEEAGDYAGPLFSRIGSLIQAGHGGQVLLSRAAAELGRQDLPPGASLLDLGEHRLKDLARPEQIYQLAAGDLPAEFPPLKTLDSHPNNLPLNPTTFVGRQREIDAARAMLVRGDIRLLTLTGAGGIGKTRLALEVAARLLGEFEDGVFFVSLAQIGDPGLVVQAIAETLGVREEGGQPLSETLKGYLKDKQMLLVLDNFEHLLDAAPRVSEQLMAAPRLKMLVTSRAALHLSAEQEFPVLPLDMPDPGQLPPLDKLSQYGAVQLFITRARAASHGFEVNNANAPAVAEICYRLDGLPLAIELAAARVRVLSPEAILARLESRLKLLTGGARDLPTRQQTLRGTIEWSYDLLQPGEQALFARLGVFVGGCTLEAVEAVCDPKGELDALDGIYSLVDKSLLRRQDQDAGEARFGMLETIREYALEKLAQGGEGAELRRRHFDYYLALSEEAEPQLKGPKQEEWVRRLEEDHGNLRAALERALGEGVTPGDGQQEAEGAVRMAAALYRFWYIHSYLSEGCRWLDMALQKSRAHPSPSPRRKDAEARALNGMGILTWLEGDLDAAWSHYEESLALWREAADKKGISMALNNLAVLAEEKGDYPGARSLLEESLTLKREMGDRVGMASSLGNLGNVLRELGNLQEARANMEESLRLERELGNKTNISGRLNDLGLITAKQGDFEEARRLHEESLAIKQALGYRWGVATSYSNLAVISIAQGDYPAARKLLADSVLLRQEIGNRVGIVEVLEDFAWLALEVGQPRQAARLYGVAEARRREFEVPLPNTDREQYEGLLARVREQLDSDAFKEEWARGEAMTIEQAVDYALGETQAP